LEDEAWMLWPREVAELVLHSATSRLGAAALQVDLMGRERNAGFTPRF